MPKFLTDSPIELKQASQPPIIPNLHLDIQQQWAERILVSLRRPSLLSRYPTEPGLVHSALHMCTPTVPARDTLEHQLPIEDREGIFKVVGTVAVRKEW